MPIETAPSEAVPAAKMIEPMAPPPTPLPRRSLGRSPLLERLEKFWKQDSPFLIAGAGLLVGAPVAYHFAAGADAASANNPALFAATEANLQSLNGLAPGKPFNGLDESDPSAWVMGPAAIHQGATGAGANSFPGGAAIRAAAGAALSSAGLPAPRDAVARAARQLDRKIAGAPAPLHLEAPSFPGLGGGASTSASIARAANTVVGAGNGTGMVPRDLKGLGGKLAWHGSGGSAEGLRSASDRQALALNSTPVSALFTNNGASPVSGSGAPASGGGIGHEGSKDFGSSGGGAPGAEDSKSTSFKDPATPPHDDNNQQPQMPSGGAPGGGGDDKKKDQKQETAQQGAQACQLVQQGGFTQKAPAGAAPATPSDTASAQQLCTKNKKTLFARWKLKGRPQDKQAYEACQAYCQGLGFGGAQ